MKQIRYIKYSFLFIIFFSNLINFESLLSSENGPIILKQKDKLEVELKNNRLNFNTSSLLNSAFDYAISHPYKDKVAYVRRGTELHEQEKNIIQIRKEKAHVALNSMLNTTLSEDEVPTIAFCCSGGGYRALVYTLGFFLGAQEFGLLDSATYMSGLSGSTWFMGSWINHHKNLDIFKKLITLQLQNNIYSGASYYQLIKLASIKYFYEQNFTLVDIWGALIAKVLLDDFSDPNNAAYMSEQHNFIKDGTYPFPIYTSAMINQDKSYHWFEFTPYEAGSSFYKAFIPIWALGRKFKNGISEDFAPEQTLGFYLGVFGSAFTISQEEFIKEYAAQIPSIFINTLNFFNTYTTLGELRVSPAIIHNPFLDIENISFSDKNQISLVDAGLNFNLPFPPILRPERKVDIIIVCDASYYIEGAPELKKAENYARKNKLKFPIINYRDIERRPVTVFKDTDPTVPVVIYMPRIKNNAFSDFNPTESINSGGYCSTFNLQYTPVQTEELSGLAYANILASKETIINTIKSVVINKKKLT